MHVTVTNALEVAHNDLRRCFTDYGILAGRKRLGFYRARDSFFASLGANALGEYTASWKSIDLFLDRQRKDGLIPHIITQKLKPHFHQIVTEPLDCNALLIIALNDYYEKSGDLQFLEKHFEKTEKAMEWLRRQDSDKDLLLEETFFGSWRETVLKNGKVLYSNCLYYKALEDFASICGALDKHELESQFRRRASAVKERMNNLFWQGNYYYDWIGTVKHDSFATDGNVLAVLFGIADNLQSQMIENKIKQHQLNKVPLQSNYPMYPFWRIPPGLFPLDAYHYHNGSSWLWLGCLNVIALHKMGWKKEAKQELKSVAAMINKHGSVHEVFFEGKPLNSLLLKSEPFFAWSSGLFVRAVKEISGK
tara:strand:- start:2330 stop:3421 length:1092 start_codon:yes stop_codon:yes gene_type:complete